MLTKAQWYSNGMILYSIVQQLKDRELMFIDKNDKEVTWRYLFAHNSEFLKMHMEELGFWKSPGYNMYHSLATFKELPLMSYNPDIRREQSRAWKLEHDKMVIGYDWGIDIDAPNLELAWDTANRLKAMFDNFKVPYSLKMSGKRGFHFLIQYKYLPHYDTWDGLIEALANVSYNLAGIYNLAIDYSIFDLKRVWKLAYSWDRGNICLPLTDEEFKAFVPLMVNPDWVLSHIMIMNRGLLERTHGLTDAELKANTKRFMDEHA